jgi:DNA repair protein RadB
MKTIKEIKSPESIPKIKTGNIDLDSFLMGGYECDIITTIYGPSGSGKTNLCIMAGINIAKEGKNVIYVDTESSFSVERFKQISGDNFKELLHNFLFLKPLDFAQQQKAFDKLRVLVDDTVGLIIIDTISMLYRLEMGQNNDIYAINKKLGKQLSYLAEISRRKKIPVLIANQVYSNFDIKDSVNMVGGDILKYGSKTLLELQNYKDGIRKLILRKSRSIAEGKVFTLKLNNSGLEKLTL